jgi:DNA-binding NarL/FixJ family response regulator
VSGGADERHGASPCPELRLVIALSHARLCDAISAALSSSGAVTVVGRAGDLAHAIELTRRAQPDGLVLGAALLKGDIVHDLRELVTEIPDARIVVVGTETSAAYGMAIKAAGAADYVALDSGTESVVSAVRRAIPKDTSDEQE